MKPGQTHEIRIYALFRSMHLCTPRKQEIDFRRKLEFSTFKFSAHPVSHVSYFQSIQNLLSYNDTIVWSYIATQPFVSFMKLIFLRWNYAHVFHHTVGKKDVCHFSFSFTDRLWITFPGLSVHILQYKQWKNVLKKCLARL